MQDKEAFSVIKMTWVDSQERDEYKLAGCAATREEASAIAASLTGKTGDIILVCPTEAVTDIKKHYTDMFIVNSSGVTSMVPSICEALDGYDESEDGWFDFESLDDYPPLRVFVAREKGLSTRDVVRIVVDCIKAYKYDDETSLLGASIAIAEQFLAGNKARLADAVARSIDILLHDEKISELTYTYHELRTAYSLCLVCAGSEEYVATLIRDMINDLGNIPPEIYKIVHKALPLRKILLLLVD